MAVLVLDSNSKLDRSADGGVRKERRSVGNQFDAHGAHPTGTPAAGALGGLAAPFVARRMVGSHTALRRSRGHRRGGALVAEGRQLHWDTVYATKAIDETSWYESSPETSLAFIRGAGIGRDDPIIDVGGGASYLVDRLLDTGFRDVTVLDISGTVLDSVRQRLGARAGSANLVQADVTSFRPTNRYALWHDRAVFHFLVDGEDRRRYLDALRAGLRPDGHVIIATFGPAGPQRCSGLPVVRYDADALGRELGSGFRLLESSLIVHRTPWAVEQQFLYCWFAAVH